jgi:hypothetical protein
MNIVPSALFLLSTTALALFTSGEHVLAFVLGFLVGAAAVLEHATAFRPS